MIEDEKGHMRLMKPDEKLSQAKSTIFSKYATLNSRMNNAAMTAEINREAYVISTGDKQRMATLAAEIIITLGYNELLSDILYEFFSYDDEALFDACIDLEEFVTAVYDQILYIKKDA